jgi:hypothetical protein
LRKAYVNGNATTFTITAQGARFKVDAILFNLRSDYLVPTLTEQKHYRVTSDAKNYWEMKKLHRPLLPPSKKLQA